MPNVERKIEQEIKRITLSLTEITREFIEGGQTFDSIDFVPTTDIYDSDDLLYFIESDPNVPLSTETDNSEALLFLEELASAIEEFLNSGVSPKSQTNYSEYLELFELDYVGPGRPVFKFGVELEDDIIVGSIELELIDGGTDG